MRLLTIFMILMFLFVGAIGFGSVNELETVEHYGCLNTCLCAHLLESVVTQETTSLELYDAQAIVAVPQSELPCIVKSFYYELFENDVNAHLTSGAIFSTTKCSHCWNWPGVHQRVVLFGPYGGLAVH